MVCSLPQIREKIPIGPTLLRFARPDCQTWLPAVAEEFLQSLGCDSVERPLWANADVYCGKLSCSYEAADLLG